MQEMALGLSLEGTRLSHMGGRDGVPGAAPYDNINGGTAIRMITPCTDGGCEYTPTQYMQSERWYVANIYIYMRQTSQNTNIKLSILSGTLRQSQ